MINLLSIKRTIFLGQEGRGQASYKKGQLALKEYQTLYFLIKQSEAHLIKSYIFYQYVCYFLIPTHLCVVGDNYIFKNNKVPDACLPFNFNIMQQLKHNNL